MRIEYINPFIDSAIEILSMTVTDNVTKGEIGLRKNITAIYGVAIIVGLAGQVSGRVVIDMDKTTALNIVSKMNEERMEDLDDMACSTLTELANMITGNAVTRLHNIGFSFDLTPPALIKGDNLEIMDNKVESLVVPLEMAEGKIEINVAIKEN